jgi:tetratricopeptide (TPR) repeat protein
LSVKREIPLFLILFLISFILYTFTLCPTVWWDDSGEFIVQAVKMDISHPPGHFLYGLLGKIFTLLPLKTIPWRVNLLSAVFGALVVGLVYLIAFHLTQNKIASCLTASTFAFCPPFFSLTNVAEIYTLKLFFFTLIIYLLLSAQSFSLLYLAGFALGLGTAGVHTELLLYLPGFLALLLLYPTIDFKVLLKVFLFFCLGLSIYLYLPLRSKGELYLNWGGVTDWKGFLKLITGAEVRYLLLTHSGNLSDKLKYFLKNFATNFGVINLILGLIGFGCLKRKWALPFLFFFLANVFFYLPHPCRLLDFFLPAFLIFNVWLGPGMTEVFKKFPQGKFFIICLLILNLSFFLKKDLKGYNRAGNFWAEKWSRGILNQLEEKSIVITEHNIFCFLLWYFQAVENKHPKSIFIFKNLLTKPWYQEKIRKKGINLELSPGQKISSRTIASQLIKQNIDQFAIYLTHLDLKWWKRSPEIRHYFPHFQKYIFRLQKKKHLSPQLEKLKIKKIPPDPKTKFILGQHYFATGRFLLQQGFSKEAFKMFKELEKIWQEDFTCLLSLANFYQQQKRYQLALPLLLKLKDEKFNLAKVYYNLGNLYLKTGKWASAFLSYQQSRQYGGKDAELYNNLGLCWEKLGYWREAVFCFKKAEKLDAYCHPAYLNLAFSYLRQGEKRKALAELKKALQIKPQPFIRDLIKKIKKRSEN